MDKPEEAPDIGKKSTKRRAPPRKAISEKAYWARVLKNPGKYRLAPEHATQLSEFFLNKGQRDSTAAQAAEHRVGWYDATLNASHWLALRSVTPVEAAMLLCQHDPHEATLEEACSISTDATEPEYFKLLLRTFEDLAGHDAQPRSLSAWEQYARVEGLHYHPWVDEYLNARKLVPPSSVTAQGASTSEVREEQQQPGAPAPGDASDGTAKKWTSKRLQELRAYREAHGTKKAAEWAGISATRVRALLPSDKPPPKGFSAFNQRAK